MSNKREIKAEQKNQAEIKTVVRTATPAKRSEKLVAAAAEKTSPVKKPAATVFEEKKSDLLVVPTASSDPKTQDAKKQKQAVEETKQPMPKRACAPYVFFATEHSAYLRKDKGFTVVEAMKGAGLAWNKMSESDKLKYEKLATADAER
jgi:hypothetical protein